MTALSRSAELSIFCPSQLNFPEGVAIDSEGTPWASGAGGELYRLTGDRFVFPTVQLKGRVLGLTPHPDGGVIACAMDEHRVVHVTAAGAVTQLGPEIYLPNCSALDAEGRLYITDSGHWDTRDGKIYRVDPDGSSRVILDGLAFANGIAISQDQSQLWVAQSEDCDVLVADLAADGTVSNVRVAVSRAQLEEHFDGHVLTDGLALDVEGNLYITLPRVDAVVAVTPAGEIITIVHDEGEAKDETVLDQSVQALRSPTNVAFGGEDGRELYIANIRTRHLTITHVAVPGLPLPGQLR